MAKPRVGASGSRRGSGVPGLHELARLWGVQPFYFDVANERRAATPEAVLALVRALGAPVEGPADVRAALRQRRAESWRTACEPVHIAWDGRPLPLELRLPAARAEARASCTLTLEDGDARVWTAHLDDLDVEADFELDGERFVAKRLPLPSPLPPGYHRLRLEGVGADAQTLVISAPRRAYGPDAREWGVFLPLYALRSRRSLAIGDLTDLSDLARWTGALGGSAIGTLPLFAAFLDEPLEPSPYAPASRLFWNELYLDLELAPGLEGCEAARSILAAPEFRRAARREAGRELVDYRRVAALKRRVLEALATDFDVADPDFRRFAADRPRLEEYARFRAATRRQRAPWPDWPATGRSGRLRAADVDAQDVRYHMYVQWAMDRQLGALARLGRDSGAGPDEREGAGLRNGEDAPRAAGLYLDIPLGVSRDGYDVWANRDLFPDGISAGAPPDALFSGGQDWGFPPMHPETLRRSGYRYFVDSLRTVMPFAGALRFDHVMSLHRLYWIPQGFGAREGTYVRYRPDEFYAILSLESHRHRTRIVGEDLGTVPQEVRAQMGRHHIGRMYVLQYEATPSRTPPVSAVLEGSVASLNTHDMPPFAGFWQGTDIEDRRDLGLLDEAQTREEHRARAALREGLASFLTGGGWLEGATDEAAVSRAALAFLASSDAWLTLAGLEDLWGEIRPQNVPGTSGERPNWRRRARLSLDALRSDPRVEGTLRMIDAIRRDSRYHNG